MELVTVFLILALVAFFALWLMVSLRYEIEQRTPYMTLIIMIIFLVIISIFTLPLGKPLKVFHYDYYLINAMASNVDMDDKTTLNLILIDDVHKKTSFHVLPFDVVSFEPLNKLHRHEELVINRNKGFTKYTIYTNRQF